MSHHDSAAARCDHCQGNILQDQVWTMIFTVSEKEDKMTELAPLNNSEIGLQSQSQILRIGLK